MTGGGSGGHITPILAVADEIKKAHPDSKIIYIGQKGDTFADIVAENMLIDEVRSVSAGKFRRYNGEGLRQLLDFKTIWLNVRDAFRVIKGFWECNKLLSTIKPDVVFCKGGFVGVPVGLAAARLKIPYLTHDSDAIPGLANRIISRWAAKHAVALDPELYPYPQHKTVNVGVPVSSRYVKISFAEQQKLKAIAGFDSFKQVLLVTGGGLGAARLNHAAVQAMPKLLKKYPDLAVIHTAGQKLEAVVKEAYDACLAPEQRQRVHVYGYTTDLATFSGMADVVVARGGATNIAELAAQGKACIIVPNPLLTGGHQLKNAIAYEEKGAIINLDEMKLKDNFEILLKSIERLLDDKERRRDLSEKLHSFARPDSAKELAALCFEVAQNAYNDKRVDNEEA